ncbi:MAG: thioredoxin family protein [Flavobacteriaceae bacterium]
MKIKLLITLAFLLINTISFSQETADSIVEKAYEQASKENKNVLVIFHASWCSWCKKLDQNLQDERINSMMEANYVITHLTVNESKDKKHLETPGGGFFLKKYNGSKAGLPFWLIFDNKGNLLGNSYGSDGKNMGSPSTKKEVEDFKNTLKKSSKLTDEELEIIGEVFHIKK